MHLHRVLFKSQNKVFVMCLLSLYPKCVECFSQYSKCLVHMVTLFRLLLRVVSQVKHLQMQTACGDQNPVWQVSKLLPKLLCTQISEKEREKCKPWCHDLGCVHVCVCVFNACMGFEQFMRGSWFVQNICCFSAVFQSIKHISVQVWHIVNCSTWYLYYIFKIHFILTAEESLGLTNN